MSPAATERPNILWICTDQQRFDTIHALGNPHVQTPVIDSLLREGVAFTHAYCQSPICTPSRASFLTGRYPRTTGCRQNGQSIRPSERLSTRILADAGYTCGLAGKLHLASCAGGRVEQRIDDGYSEFHWSHHPQPDWQENAYSQWLAERGTSWEALYTGEETPYVKLGVPADLHQTTWCAETAIDFIRRHRDGPWLFSVNPFDPHHPFDPPPEYWQRYDPATMPLPAYREGELAGKPEYQRRDHQWAHDLPGYFQVAAMSDDDRRQVTAAYYAMIELIDDQLARMLAALEETGQRQRTIVVFMSDHGEMLGDHGLYLKGPHFYEQAVRVPLVLCWPERIESGLKVSGLVELIDLAPTLLELVNVPVPEAMQGRSLLPILQGQQNAAHHRDHVYCEYYNAWTHKHAYGTMLRTEKAKIVVYHGSDEGEIYDLAADPGEFENLWGSDARRDLREHLLQTAFDASVFTMDPLPPRLGPF